MTHIHQKIHKPSQFLVENIDILPRGKALDLAMGNGRNAVYLAKRGFDVEGVDISAESAKRTLELAHNSGVTVNALVADLENSYRIEKDTYKVIVCFNYLYRPIIQQIKEGLCIGGMVVYETFIIDQAHFGKPKNPDHLLKHNELLDLFREFRCLRYHEGIFESQRAIAGIVAQKT
jgi:tellurite methyltransferase